MYNKFNNGTAQGQLVSKPYINDVKGGNKNAFLALKCPDSYETRDEHGCYIRRSQHLEFRCFIPDRNKELLALMENLQRDNEVRITYSVRTNHYTDKEGNEVRRQDLQVEDIVLVSQENQPGHPKGHPPDILCDE